MSYQTDRKWSDQFIPAIRAIVGPHLLVPSSLEVDTKEAADLVVLRGRDMTVACRIRRPGFVDRYPWEFTIRRSRDSGARTELAKLTEGWGDWMFYGHAGAAIGSVERWFLIDLHAWRQELMRDWWRAATGMPMKHAKQARTISNHGDGTHFIAFDVRLFPLSLLIASSHEVPRVAAA